MARFGGYEDQAFLAEYYDLIPRYVTRPDVDFYVGFSRAADGATLELGCGTGRILIPTAAAGPEIVGLDISEYMLAKCRQKLQGQPPAVQERVRLVQDNMASFDLGQTFSLITMPFRSFQHLLHVHEQLSCLQCAHRHLARDAKLIVEVFQVKPQGMYHPKWVEESEDFDEVKLSQGRKLRRTHRVAAFHRAEQYNDREMIYYVTHPDGQTERLVQACPFRYFFRYEIEHLLARCSFRVVELFGDFDQSPLTDESPEMIFVAEKH